MKQNITANIYVGSK